VSIGIVLGSGLGGFVEAVEGREETPYAAMPGWPVPTVEGHAGKLITGRVDGAEVIVLAGRAHLYEGHTALQLTAGIRELARRGVRNLILTNAAGGINLNYKPGDLVLISDHINLMGANPLVGPQFIDMSEPYSEELRDIAKVAAAQTLGLALEEGIYAGVHGPSFETPAEIRYLRVVGADLVGMSTVPETIAAVHAGMRVLGISCVTNMAAGILDQRLSHHEVLEIGERVKGTVSGLLRSIIPRLM
jgi:purine-nucleoside phosphorylase